jgi:hypothetical protein
MGWRKLTVRDGDLARCCAAQGPVICEASLGVCFDAAASSLAVRQWTLKLMIEQPQTGSTQSQAVWSVHVEFDSAAITIAAPGMQDGAF